MRKINYPSVSVNYCVAVLISLFLFSSTVLAQCNFTVSPSASAYGCYNTLEDVVWVSAVNQTVLGNEVSKTAGGTGWNAGSFSNAAVYNNGYVETVVAETNTSRMIGLSNTNVDANFTSIPFVVYLRADATLEIYESNNNRGNVGAYATGDTIRIRAERGKIKYYKNSVLLYASNVTPTFPLYADNSLNVVGATLKKVVIGNLSNGSFKAIASTPGTSPTYQWKLNGVNVGTNSSTYSNTALALNDALTCVITPGIGGCSVPPVTSNTVRIKFRDNYNYGDFYISATPAATSCTEAVAKVVWDSLSTNLGVSGNNLTKTQSNGNWDGGAASLNTVSTNGYLQFTATETNKLRAIGLSTTNANANFTSIQYAFYLNNTGNLQIYESNTNRGTFGTYAANDVFKIAVEGTQVKYYQNNNLLYQSNVVPTLPLLVDVSLNEKGATITNALVSNYSLGNFTATVTTAGTPTYQWKLNGGNVGTNNASYANAALNANDVVSCELTSSLSGCSTVPYTSNTITNKPAAIPVTTTLYIRGSSTSSACFAAEEEVKWKATDFANVVATNNNLSKTQSGGAWDGGAASFNTVANNGYFQFIASETNTLRAAGLSASNTNSNVSTIQYAFYLNATGGLQIYESNTNRGTFGTYNTGDVLKIAVEAFQIKYYQNGTLLYISTVSPILPLLVDVSLNTLNATINNVVVANYNTGSFIAVATNAGSPPTYQWKLNGINVGSNASFYTNTTLTNNDAVTCVLIPNISGCNTSTLTSNAITYKPVTASSSIEFYIQGSASVSGCNSVDEEVSWRSADFNFVQGSGNNLYKIQSDGNWDGGAASWNTVANFGYVQFTAAETNKYRMAGLSSFNGSTHYNTIQYAWYLVNNGTLRIYESGTDRGAFGTYSTGDVFRVAVENNLVRYYQNGNLVYTSAVAPTLPLLVDVSLYNTGSTLNNVIVSNYSTGVFIATATNAGVSPAFQWKVNGTNVGTNSATYTNVGLSNNDVITCVLTPSLTGCAGTAYVSNTLTNKALSAPANIEFYIQGTAAASACVSGEEQVRWKLSDFNYVIVSSGNNLSKVQSNNVWDGGAASWNTVNDNGYLQFTAAENNTFRSVGLSTTNTNNHYNTIQYAFYLTNVGSVQVMEFGTNRGTFGTYNANDVFTIAAEAGVVKYYQNGTLLYISTITPTFPMLVDASLYSINSTVTNAVVGNYNTGRFTATATNTGGAPVYQWKLNGVNVGTNNPVYTNAAVTAGDVVTCVLTPNLGGCTNALYTSNAVAVKSVPAPNGIELVIQGTVVTSGCNNAEEAVVWKASESVIVQASGNDLTKIQSDGNWDGGSASYNTVYNNGYVQFTASETNTARMLGLSTTNASASYTTIQYAVYLLNNGTVSLFESGNNVGNFGTYASNDIFRIAVENNAIKYYQNGDLMYTSIAPPTLPLLVDASIRSNGGTIMDVVVSNYNGGVFTATATNAGPAPVYQWQLNGVNVGTNNTTYTNNSLNNNDVITCLVNPNIAACTGIQYTSNAIINRSIAAPTSLEFYVEGSPAATACNIAEEQVRWENSDYVFVIGSNNNLTKVQSNGNWDGGASSWNKVANNGYFQFTASETNTSRMAGLSTTNADASYTSIQYAIYLVNTGALQIYESGTNRGTFGSYSANDVLKIAVEAGVVKYYQNGNLLYISNVAPTLPMFVDVSIRHVNGTVTNALVGNYNTGTFTATALNAGVSPSFQWKVNGGNVGTNSSTYVNAGLNVNDVVSCVLTPSLAGCSATTYASNTITNKSISISSSIEFHVKGTPSITACLAAEEQVRWKISDLANVQALGNSLSKVQSGGNWDGGAASWNTVANNGYFRFIASETNTARMAGLSTANADANYTSIQYAFYLQNTGSLSIYEAGNSKGTFGTYAPTDTLVIAVEALVVKYYQNGNLLYISTVAPVLPMVVDVSINTISATIFNAVVANNNTGTFTATAINAGVSPAYQWKLNGTNVGTNNSTYTNTGLLLNDVVTCVLTPNLSGCGATTYTSNSIINKSVKIPIGIDFYIQGAVATSACNTGEEQVRWKIADLSNVQVSGNNVSKLQSNGNWDGGAASLNTVLNNGYFQFTVTETNTFRSAGLSTTNTNSHYNTIQYAFYLTNSGSLQIIEAGTSRGAFGTYLSGDVLKVSVEAGIVKYYQNGNLLYISAVAPVLPMLVDVSINNNGGTISNAIVSNFNTGTFNAMATNVGPSPVYQWKLNGSNVGTNSTTYTNTALLVNDVVTCVLSPNLGGCDATTYASNSITNKAVAAPASIDFYVQATATVTACNIVEEQVKWKTADLFNVLASTNNLTKIQSNGNWDGGAASWNTVSNNGYLQFNLNESNTHKAIGLSTTNANSNYTSIQYAFYLTNTGSLQIHESGVSRGAFSAYTSSDTLRIAVESSVVKYYQNGTLLYVSAVVPTLPMLVDASLYHTNSTFRNVLVGNYTTATFTASATNAGVMPAYQWKLNGVNVGTNSSTYVNASLANNDVVTCLLTPNLGGCTGASYGSNSVTVKTAPIPNNVDFCIRASAGSSACNSIAEEQVKWKLTDQSSNVVVSGNNLNKIQSGGNWDGGAASWNTVNNNGYFQFMANETSTARMAGLSTTNTDANFSTIQYAIYLNNAGGVQIYESNNNRGTFTTYASNDIFKVAVESNVVKYYKNNVLLYISGVAPNLPLLVDVSINGLNGTIMNAIVGNYTTNTFTAAATNAGGTPSYQWKVNGVNAGTNSSTYSNTGLAANDVVTCVLTTSVAGCGALSYASNNITEKLSPAPSNLDFYIKGTSTILSCNLAEEQVKWKLTDLNYVQATTNNLYKFQSNNVWDGGAASWNTVSNNGFLQFTAIETNRARTVGLSNVNTDNHFNSIQFGIYLLTNATIQVVESGVSKGVFGSYAANDVFKIAVDGGVVKYYRNNVLFYTSLVIPVPPLLVDVSIYTNGATVSNALVSNYNSGAFTAAAVNAGTHPTYQWQVNGANVGTNSPTYINGTLNINDQVTCILTPDITGCILPVVNSNVITNRSTAAPAAIELYMLGSIATSGCAIGEEQVKWKVSDLTTNMQATGNNLNKNTSNGNWNGGASSWNRVNNNGYLQFTATETNKYRMVGLSPTNANADYTSIGYAIYLVANSTVQIYESGTNRGTVSTYAANDVFRIAVESGVVKYYKNGTLLYISAVVPTLPMLVDVSIYNTGGTVTNAVVGNINNGTFVATVSNAGPSPSYQWKVNGTNTGTNSNTFTNAALLNNDVVTVVVTPDLGLCNLNTYPSNSVTNKTNPSPVGIDFYIQGTAAVTACNADEEQVVWKTADFNNVQGIGNNLNKIQFNGWDGGAASWNTVKDNGYFQFTATETNKSRMAGLSTTNANADYVTIQYAVYLLSNNTFQIYESGNYRGSFGTYLSGDVFRVAVDAGVVKYYQNGNLLYISTVAPVLPMLVDVSINHVGGTVTNALVSNYNTGVFIATATNVGTSPIYQWKLNGGNVGTNSATYTNTALLNNDVITCTIRPNLGGCGVANYTSNTITNKTITAPTSIDFYIQGVMAVSACNTAEEQVKWKTADLSNVQATGNNLNKIQSNSNWDGGAASWNTVNNNGYFQFTATETNRYRAVGLSTTNANSNYTSIQYAFYLVSNGTVQIHESGTSRGNFGPYAANDVFRIAIESSVVKYYKNGTLLYISAVAPVLPMLVDVSIYNTGGTVTNAIISNYNTGSFVATATGAGVSPSYQWKVNGGNVGTNSSTYANTALNLNDVVTCVLTPNLGGCSAITYTSNSITEKVVTNPTNLDFYIQGTVAGSACNTVEEQVKWKISDLVNVKATGNSLLKIQSNGNWDGGAASWNTISNNGYFQFTATETNEARMAGLSTTNVDANFNTIQYAVYLLSNSLVQIYESGNNRGTMGTFVTGDVFKVAVEAGVVKYYQNANLLYISSVAPTLPLLVDVSIHHSGGTITDAVVSNYNVGSFVATSINAGTTPAYQWKVNGGNVGTNSSTYTNTSLNANDVVTCELTPNLAGCNATTYTSNALTNKQVPAPFNLDFYIQGSVTSSACNTVDEQVKWKVSDLNYVVAAGNSILKVQSNGTWDGGAASWNTVSNNGYFQFSVSETSTNKVAGLSTTNASSSNSTVQFGFNLSSSSIVNIIESNAGRGSYGSYSSGDIFKIAVEANVVKYYKNNTLLYISAVAPVLPMLVDVSIRDIGGAINNAIVSNYNTGTFVATALNAGVSPVYQWKLNGVNVGINSTTYTNASLATNDAVTCVLTPSLGGCSTATYVSNTITNQGLNLPTSIDFYVLGNVEAASCATVDEQVRWKISDYQNVQGTNNNLVKVQSNGNWDGGAASWNTISNNGYLQFTATETNRSRIVGLSSINANSNYTSIQYAYNLTTGGVLIVYESGTSRGSVGSYAPNDILKIAVQANVVKYYKNGTLLYTSGVVPTLPLLVDVSIRDVGGTVNNAIVSNLSSGLFTVTATNAGTTPSFQWKVNGANVGTNSTTYSNASLTNNDVVSCVLTPNLPGCSSASYTSNTAVYRATNITTHPVSQPVCTGGSFTLNVVATGNSLNYQWRKNGVNIPGALNSSYTINNANASDGGNYDVIVNTGGCTSNVATVTISNTNQWSGITSSAWSILSNWTCGLLPTAVTDVIIPSAAVSMPVISSTVSVKSITINTSGSVTNNGTLNLFGNFVNNGTYTDNGTTVFAAATAQSSTGTTTFNNLTLSNASGLTLNSTTTAKGVVTLTNGALATGNNLSLDLNSGAISGAGTGTITGTITYFKTVWGNKYHYISSPAVGATINDWNDNVPFKLTGNANYYTYNEAVPDTNKQIGWTPVAGTATSIQMMKGYALYFKLYNTPVDVTGPYNHAASYTSGTLTNTASTNPGPKPASDGWHLLGNPYPSTLDWDAGTGWTKAGLDAGIYYWDPATNRHASYVSGVGTNGGTKYIPSMQGFWVRVTNSGGTGSLAMTKAVRTTAGNSPGVWRVASNDNLLRLSASSSGYSDETVVRFTEDATAEFDPESDAYKLMNSESTPSVFTVTDAEYSINSLPSSLNRTTIPVKINTGFAGSYTFTADITGLADVDSILFVDKVRGVTQNLKTTPTYTCSLGKGEVADRFYINYKKREEVVTSTTASNVLANVNIFAFEQDITVNFNKKAVKTADIYVYDIAGNTVYKAKSQSISAGKIKFKLSDVSSGVYIVKVADGFSSTTQEIVITPSEL